ncbi:MAG: hypothetical protein ABI231_09075, partial [Candidatus Tumulicola sp.]
MKMNRTAALAAMLALAGVGCSGSHGANAQTRAPAQQPASDSAAAGSAASESAAPAEANHVTDSRLPIYPGATKQHEQFQGIMKICGATMSMTAYAIKDADAATVAKWYKDRIPSGVQVSISPDTNSTNYEIFEPDGSGAAVVTQVHFAGNLAKAAKSIGADETTFATETF